MFIDVLGVTGHRPDKLGGYDDDVFDRLFRFAKQQLRILKPQYVITGMALGWDQAIALAAKKSGIPFLAYTPFQEQASAWPEYAQDRYNELLGYAFKVVNVGGMGYSAAKMFQRNERIVNDSDIVLALWNGSSGGTANCIDYADRNDIEIINCWNDWERFCKPTPKPIKRKHPTPLNR